MSDTEQHPQSDSGVALGPGAWIGRSALRFTFSRSGGPGGQAVNKLSTRAQLRVAITAVRGLDEAAAGRLRHLAGRRLTLGDEIIIEAETHRSQLDNKLECVDRLRQMVTSALVKPKLRKKSKPSRGMIERRLKAKRRASEKKGLRRARRLRGDEER